jgi:hypothetical protein
MSQVQVGKLVSRGTQLVENMIISFVGSLKYDSRLLQQVSSHRRPTNMKLFVKLKLYKLSKPGTVIVSRRFRVTYGLEYNECKKTV